nr:hypothetical protein [Tanacetum cinerariifolium]
MTDYSLWEVILNGDSPTPTRVVDGVVQSVAPLLMNKGKDTLQGSVGLLKIQERMAAMTRVFKQNGSLLIMLLWPFYLQVLLTMSDESLPPSPIYGRYQSGNGYHVVPPPYTGTFMPPKPDLVFNNAPNNVETDQPAFNVQLSPTKPAYDLPHTYRPSLLLLSQQVQSLPAMANTGIERHALPRQAKTVVTKTNLPPIRHINRGLSPKPSNFPPKVTSVKAPMVNAAKGNPQHALKDKGVIDSGCSRHMTRNMSYLFDFEELNGGYVAFGGNLKGGNQSNPSAGVQEQFDAEKVGEEIKQQYVIFPVWSSGFTNPHNTDGNATFDEKEPEFDEKKPKFKVNDSPSSSAQSKKYDDKTKKEAKGKSHVESLTGYRNLSAKFEDFSDKSINEVNAVGTLVSAVG